MENKELLEQLTAHITKLNDLANEAKGKKSFSVDFFYKAFEITGKVQGALHQLEISQIKQFEKHFNKRAASPSVNKTDAVEKVDVPATPPAEAISVKPATIVEAPEEILTHLVAAPVSSEIAKPLTIKKATVVHAEPELFDGVERNVEVFIPDDETLTEDDRFDSEVIIAEEPAGDDDDLVEVEVEVIDDDDEEIIAEDDEAFDYENVVVDEDPIIAEYPDDDDEEDIVEVEVEIIDDEDDLDEELEEIEVVDYYDDDDDLEEVEVVDLDEDDELEEVEVIDEEEPEEIPVIRPAKVIKPAISAPKAASVVPPTVQPMVVKATTKKVTTVSRTLVVKPATVISPAGVPPRPIPVAVPAQLAPKPAPVLSDSVTLSPLPAPQAAPLAPKPAPVAPAEEAPVAPAITKKGATIAKTVKTATAKVAASTLKSQTTAKTGKITAQVAPKSATAKTKVAEPIVAKVAPVAQPKATAPVKEAPAPAKALVAVLAKDTVTKPATAKKSANEYAKLSFTLNDRFRFYKILFDKDEEKMNQIIEKLNAIGTLGESIEFLKGEVDWDFDGKTATDFLKVVENRFA